MIRMIQSRDAAHAKGYFGDALSRPDYYINDQELPGVWQGRLAERLSLSGGTRRADFFALCENRHPRTGERLTPSTKKNRRTGYDINFHCPKSVSLLHALSPDDRILRAFRDSVAATMQAIEADSRTRVRVGGRSEDRISGELAWAEFVHQTARPVAGSLPDPHLHAHCFVFNAAWDPAEKRIKAGQFGEIQHDMPLYQALFQKTLADRLAAAGYPIRPTAASFEIDGVPQRVIDAFSKRTDAIGRAAREKGITDAKDLDALGARTRARKDKGARMADLVVDWRRQIAALGPDMADKVAAVLRDAQGTQAMPAPEAAPTMQPDFAQAAEGSRPTAAPGPKAAGDTAGADRDAQGKAAAPAPDPAFAIREAFARASGPGGPHGPETAARHGDGGERPGQGRPDRTVAPGRDMPQAEAPTSSGEDRAAQDAAPSPPLRRPLRTPGAARPDVGLLTAQACVDYALLHGFERASVMDERRLLETALRHAVGRPSAPAAEIMRALRDDPRLIHVQERDRMLCTTKDVLREEKRMVELARAGQGQMRPLYDAAPEIALTGQQRQAVAHILTTPHRVSIIRGVAGSGKTALMPEAVALIERAGKTVMAVAPTTRASRGTLRETGFKDATTVARLLTDTAMQDRLRDQVLWVDEAGMLGTKDMTDLLDLAARQNARLILMGDTRQHASVRRGDALRILNTVAQIPVAEVAHIRRQTTAAYRDVVKDLSEGNVARAFQKLDQMGCIKDLGEHDPVRDYLDAVTRGKTALMISPTHAQGEVITAEIRTALRAGGRLGKKEVEVVCLKPLNLTEAEKSDPRSFLPGQVVQFTQNVPGIQRGSQWTVALAAGPHISGTGLRIVNAHGETLPLPVAHPARFDVFDKGTIPLSTGDTVRITRNGVDAEGGRLNNGDVFRVVALPKGGPIVLQNDVSHVRHKISPAFGHIAHAHCITSQAAQSRGVDEVFIFQPTGAFGATDAKQFYVSVSRGKHRAHIYTDDRTLLLHHAENLRERQSALELMRHDPHKAALWHQHQPEPTPRRQGGRDYEP